MIIDIKAHDLERSLGNFRRLRDRAGEDPSVLEKAAISLEDLDTVIDHISSTRGNVVIPDVPM